MKDGGKKEGSCPSEQFSRSLCKRQDTSSGLEIDDDSCGVFCLSFLDSIIRGLPISGRTTQAVVDKLRKDYAFEIFLNNTDPSE